VARVNLLALRSPTLTRPRPARTTPHAARCMPLVARPHTVRPHVARRTFLSPHAGGAFSVPPYITPVGVDLLVNAS